MEQKIDPTEVERTVKAVLKRKMKLDDMKY